MARESECPLSSTPQGCGQIKFSYSSCRSCPALHQLLDYIPSRILAEGNFTSIQEVERNTQVNCTIASLQESW